MLLHGVLKCYILFFLFVICVTAPMSAKSKSRKGSPPKYPQKHVKEKKALRDAVDDTSSNALAMPAKSGSAGEETNGPNQLKVAEDISSPTLAGKPGSSAEGTDKSKEGPESQNAVLNQGVSTPATDSANEQDQNSGSDSESGKNTGTMLDLNTISVKSTDVKQLSAIPGYSFSPSELSRLNLWDGGLIPFYIDDLSYDKVLRDTIREHLDNANTATGLRFLELTKPPEDDNSRWVFFVNRRGQLNCTDYTPKSFTESGVQRVVMGYDCFSDGGAMAAVVLALAGVHPQHNAPDRDKYITVSTKSIQPDKVKLFEAVKPEEWLFHDMKYDFQSAGHYPLHKHTVDGTATIQPVHKHDETVGEAKGLSPQDILKIRVLYNNVVAKSTRNVKLPECAIMYQPGANFENIQTLHAENLPTRKKPKQYVEAARNAGVEVLDDPSDPDVANSPTDLPNDNLKSDSDSLSSTVKDMNALSTE